MILVKLKKRTVVALIISFGLGSFLQHITKVSNGRFLELDRVLVEKSGNGNCIWSSPIVDSDNIDVHGTLITGFPGVGKRLVWTIVEQFTNRKVGDDWDISGLENKTITVKSSFPHPEGNWSWGDRMHQSILVVRNPMDVFRSYHNIKREIGSVANVSQVKELNKMNDIYSRRASLEDWIYWRDAEFDHQMDLYGWFIEYWMDNGRRRNNGNGEAYNDPRCKEKMAGGCVPKAVINYDTLMDPESGENETAKLASVLVESAGVYVIDESIWSCAYREIMKKNKLYSDKRRSSGPKDSYKSYSQKQMKIMRNELERLRDKYDLPVYSKNPAAVQLVVSLNQFLVHVNSYFDVGEGEDVDKEEDLAPFLEM